MARWQPITTLKSRIIHHPPVAVFFLCLLFLAGAFVSIGIYSQNHDIKNPDVNMDWNELLDSLADLKFCTQINETDLLNEKPDATSPLLLDHPDEPINTTQQNSEVISMFLLVPLMHIGDELDHNSISASLVGNQLGFKGYAGKQSVNISLFLNVQTYISTTDSEINQNLSNKQVKSPSYSSCLKIIAPRRVLPQTPSPPQCPFDNNMEKNISPVKAHAIHSSKKSSDSLPCLSLRFTPDPKLTVFLTQDEKTLARYHLMLVSFVLLALCLLMCCFGTLTCSKSRRHLARDPHKETLLR